MRKIYWLFWWIAVEYIWQNSRKIVETIEHIDPNKTHRLGKKAKKE
jgi:hypothetical protein